MPLPDASKEGLARKQRGRKVFFYGDTNGSYRVLQARFAWYIRLIARARGEVAVRFSNML